MKSNWLVKFMRRGFEPPMPFGKSRAVVSAVTRDEAVQIVNQSGMVSPNYPKVTASRTTLQVDYHFQWTKEQAS